MLICWHAVINVHFGVKVGPSQGRVYIYIYIYIDRPPPPASIELKKLRPIPKQTNIYFCAGKERGAKAFYKAAEASQIAQRHPKQLQMAYHKAAYASQIAAEASQQSAKASPTIAKASQTAAKA